jgi:hypothetical protein
VAAVALDDPPAHQQAEQHEEQEFGHASPECRAPAQSVPQAAPAVEWWRPASPEHGEFASGPADVNRLFSVAPQHVVGLPGQDIDRDSQHAVCKPLGLSGQICSASAVVPALIQEACKRRQAV